MDKDDKISISSINSNFKKSNSYEILATTNNAILKPVYNFKVDDDSNYYLEIIASAKSISSVGGFYISQKYRIIDDNNNIQIIQISNEFQSLISDVAIILTKSNGKIFINLKGHDNTKINWTVLVNVIVAQ
jgi:hypothetical protein